MLERVDLATLRSQGYVFNIELTYRALRAGFQVTEVPIVFHDRSVGESKISLSIAIEALWLVPVLRFPWLRRRWPARTAPLVNPRIDPAEPFRAGDPGAPGDEDALPLQPDDVSGELAAVTRSGRRRLRARRPRA